MKYPEITLSGVKEALAYRLEFFSRIMSNSINLLILWFVWSSVFAASGTESIKGFTLSTMITYLTISSLIKPLTSSSMDYSMEQDVRTGNIGTMLTKPVSYPLFLLFRSLGVPLTGIFLGALPIFAIGLVLLGISLPYNLPAFLLSLFFGFLVNYIMIFMTGLWSFWSAGSIWGIKLSKEVITEIMSGAVVPIYFFPSWFASIAQALPFQAIYNIPISIYLGNITGTGILFSFAQQLFWIALLGSVSYMGWRRAKKKVVINGG
jgi:ABC-2 type transport system permease protein